MSGVVEFLTAIGPSLLSLGRELFRSTGGDVAKARKVIKSRTEELRLGRAAIDAEAKRRFGR